MVTTTQGREGFDLQNFLRSKFQLQTAIQDLQKLLADKDLTQNNLIDLNTKRHHIVEYDTILAMAVKRLDELDQQWHQLAEHDPVERQKMLDYLRDDGDYATLFSLAKLVHYEALALVHDLDLAITEIKTKGPVSQSRNFQPIPGATVNADDRSLPSADPFLPTFQIPKAPPRPPLPKQTVPLENDDKPNVHWQEELASIVDKERRPPTPLPRKLRTQLTENPVEMEQSSASDSSELFPTVSAVEQPPLFVPQLQPVQFPVYNYLPIAPISIPKFSGNVLTEWTSFFELFVATVDAQPHPAVYKFSMLKSLLEGPALNLVKTLPITAQNYQEALNLLQKRFGNTSLIESALHTELRTLPTAFNSTASLRQTLDKVELIVTQLENLKSDVNNGTLSDLIMSKFPDPLFSELVVARRNNRQWSTKILREKLDESICVREEVAQSKLHKLSVSENGKSDHKSRSNPVPKPCYFCDGEHLIKDCPLYSTPQSRLNCTKNLGLCQGCLRKGHFVSECSKAKMCSLCHTKHHSLLPHHQTKPFNSAQTVQPPNSNRPLEVNHSAPQKQSVGQSGAPWQAKNVNSSGKGQKHASTAPLQTAWSHATIAQNELGTGNFENQETEVVEGAHTSFCVNLNTVAEGGSQLLVAPLKLSTPESNIKVQTHLLLDSGSTHNFLSTVVIERLGLKPFAKRRLNISGFGGTKISNLLCSVYTVQIHLSNGETDKLTVFGVDRVCQAIPQSLVHAKNVAFSVDGHIQPQLLIGTSTFLHLLLSGPQKSETPNETFLETRIGKIFVNNQAEESLNKNVVVSALAPVNPKMKLQEGRYSLKWPFKKEMEKIDDHFSVAFFRCRSLWRKLHRNPEQLQRYNDEILRMLKEEVIELAPVVPTGNLIRYVPHHAVFKGSKIRVVFNASATRHDHSINEMLDKGTNLLPLLTSVLIRFRLPTYVIIADIAKAFNTLALDPDQRDITRFIWLKDISKPLTYQNMLILRFCRVVFGFSSSPNMLAEVLHEHLKQFGKFGLMLLFSLYVDNLFWSVSSLQEAVESLEQCRYIFGLASMLLHEINSNLSEFNAYLNENGVDTPKTVKFLGIWVNFERDQLELTLPFFANNILTKRIALQFTASVFDPLGFLAPIVLQARMFVQELWKLEVKWDEPLNNDLLQKWSQIVQDWYQFKFVLQRQTAVPEDADRLELHTFTDASKSGRGVVSFLLVSHNNQVTLSLIQAKSRLTPTKQPQTIPRLELDALLMGVELQHSIQNDMNLGRPLKSFVWCDNASSLWWVRAETDKKLPSFVRRRVDMIQVYKDVQIRYVPGELNIADIASRGCSASELAENKTWFAGPEWLKNPSQWPNSLPDMPAEDETVNVPVLAAVNEKPELVSTLDFGKFSSLETLLRTYFFVFKFLSMKSPAFMSKIGLGKFALTLDSLTKSQIALRLIKIAQSQSNITDSMQKTYLLIKDENGVWVRHTRLPNLGTLSRLGSPTFLPRDHTITILIIAHVHQIHNHTTSEHTFHLVRKLWFIPKGRNVVKQVINKCSFCKRFLCKPFKLPNFPEFPANRVLQSKPFTYIGVDLFGPIKAKRGEITVKVYGVIFACYCTRALHLELALNCTATNLLHCLRRFIARRGCPRQILSDNAPSLIMVQSILETNKTTAQIQTNLEIREFLNVHGITWKFIPAFAPWHGSVYESLICSVKQAIQKAIGRRIVTEEHLRTILAEAEAIVNTRPITYISNDEESPVLSPADFLQTNPLFTPLLIDDDFDPDDEEWKEKVTGRDVLIRAWQNSQVILAKLWKVFQASYLTGLQDRYQQKHKQGRSLTEREPEVGEMVLVKDPELPRCQWRLARIEALSSEPYRSATIRLGEKTGRRTVTTRPLNLLCPLELRCVLIFLLILCLQRSVLACSNVATLTASSTNCVEFEDGAMNCSIKASTLVTLRAGQQEACIQIVSENRTHYAVYAIQPKNLRLTGRTSSVLFSRQTHVRTSHSRRCDRGTGSDCFGNYCEEVTDDTRLKDLSTEAQNAIGYSRCHRSCGCAWCNQDGEAGCGLCSAGCLFYRFYMVPASDQVYRIFKTPTYDPVLNVTVILPDLSSRNALLSPSLPQIVESLNLTLTVSDIPPLPILANTFLESVQEQLYAILPETVDLSLHLHCKDFNSAKSFDCQFPAKTCTCSPSDYKPNCVCASVQWHSIIQDANLKLPLDLGNGALLNFHNNVMIVDTQFPSQLHVSIDAEQVRLITHQSTCYVNFVNVTGCMDCDTPPAVYISCRTNFGSTTVTFDCSKSTMEPILCSKEEHLLSTKLSTLNVEVSDECQAQCPANSVNFQLSGQLSTKSIQEHQNETGTHEKEESKVQSWFEGAWTSVKSWFSSLFGGVFSWYLWIVVPLIVLLALGLCCFFLPQLSAILSPIVAQGREFFQSSRSEISNSATAWTPMRHRPSWSARLRRPNSAESRF